jgi:hypothetical protein
VPLAPFQFLPSKIRHYFALCFCSDFIERKAVKKFNLIAYLYYAFPNQINIIHKHKYVIPLYILFLYTLYLQQESLFYNKHFCLEKIIKSQLKETGGYKKKKKRKNIGEKYKVK